MNARNNDKVCRMKPIIITNPTTLNPDKMVRFTSVSYLSVLLPYFRNKLRKYVLKCDLNSYQNPYWLLMYHSERGIPYYLVAKKYKYLLKATLCLEDGDKALHTPANALRRSQVTRETLLPIRQGRCRQRTRNAVRVRPQRRSLSGHDLTPSVCFAPSN